MKYNIICRDFVCSRLPTAMCHASTVLPQKDRTFCAWFGGSREGERDVGIYLAERKNEAWGTPRRLAGGDEAHWNPVLCEHTGGLLTLYYKVGMVISRWRTMVCHSADGGLTWSEPRELVSGDVGGRGPVRCKVIRLAGGRLLAPASVEHGIWESFADISDDGGKTWRRSSLVRISEVGYQAGERLVTDSTVEVSEQSFHGRGVIQPTLWESSPEAVQMLMRSSEGRVYRSDSADGGETWCPAYPTTLPNNNSGIDVVRMDSGALILAHNPVEKNWGERSPMTLAISRDNGASWKRLLDLDSGEGEFSYPAVVAQGSRLHITYTWKRKTVAYWQIEIESERG